MDSKLPLDKQEHLMQSSKRPRNAMALMPLLLSRQPLTTLFLKAYMIKDISIPVTCKLIKE